VLVAGTHPTGQYDSAKVTACDLTSDRRELRVTIRCVWRGGLSANAYETVFRFLVEKVLGVTDLQLLSDTAVFSVNEAYREATRGRLHEYWDSGR
jgi:hypothetical protein